MARPGEWTTGLGTADANDLFAHFLIDVEMSACQLTSRIKQAIGLGAALRAALPDGPRTDVQTSDGKWLQWKWMKNYRVWEANRKVWLYPENWIEPELRDDKTPFFKELETELLQGLDDERRSRPLLHYLEKLDQVARLEICGMYEDDEDKSAARLRPHVQHAARLLLPAQRRRDAVLDAVGEGGARHRGRSSDSGGVEPKADAALAGVHRKAGESRSKMPEPGDELDVGR